MAIKKKVVKKAVKKPQPKKGLAGAGNDAYACGFSKTAVVAPELWDFQKSLEDLCVVSRAPKDFNLNCKNPIPVAIDKFSLSLVSESMLAMVAMHAIVSSTKQVAGSISFTVPARVAELSVGYARAVMVELNKK